MSAVAANCCNCVGNAERRRFAIQVDVVGCRCNLSEACAAQRCDESEMFYSSRAMALCSVEQCLAQMKARYPGVPIEWKIFELRYCEHEQPTTDPLLCSFGLV